MKTETTNRLTDLLSQIPQNMHSMYQIELIEEREYIVIKHPFWIFFEEKHIREITIEEVTITIKCKHIAIVMCKNRVDAQVILF
tara:strand:+ start:1108 stop:1359 length:252 start_codon:yes stop_codon:yes gene_type:complete